MRTNKSKWLRARAQEEIAVIAVIADIADIAAIGSACPGFEVGTFESFGFR
jgi:hypothetical protein